MYNMIFELVSNLVEEKEENFIYFRKYSISNLNTHRFHDWIFKWKYIHIVDNEINYLSSFFNWESILYT